MDMVPGQVSYIWFAPIRTGTFEILCAELCGVGHPQMRGTVVVRNRPITKHGSRITRRGTSPGSRLPPN